MQLSGVVPWGRCLREYIEMFLLSASDLEGSILGCGDGPASFNAEVTAMGKEVVSVDPIYAFSRRQIQARINEVYPEISRQAELNKDNYVWKTFQNVEEVLKARMSAMEHFLKDYDSGKKAGRYIEASLPSLPFKNSQFSLAICSHFLFLYSSHVSESMHKEGIKELCRVAREVRIYPIVTLEGKPSPHLEPIIKTLKNDGRDIELKAVKYSFQKNATEMLVVKSA